MKSRLGSIEIGGETYPLNYSMRIAQRYNDIAAEKISGDLAVPTRNLRILALMMDDAAAYMRTFCGEEVRVLSYEELELCTSPADTKKISDAILDTLKKAGVRLVEVEPPKNSQAAPERKGSRAAKNG